MKEIKLDIPYQPISCELHSEYELAIMHKNRLCLTWHEDGEVVTEENIIPVDIQVKNKAEYLVVKISGQKEFFIRLDFIIKMQVSHDNKRIEL